jgi:hypothetical protein
VTVETAVPGGRAMVDIERGSVLPDDVPDEQVQTCLALGTIRWAGDGAAAAAEPDVDLAEWTPPKGSIAAVLKAVGTHPGKAAVALEVERASGRPRSTLVAALERLAGDAAAAQQPAAGGEENRQDGLDGEAASAVPDTEPVPDGFAEVLDWVHAHPELVAGRAARALEAERAKAEPDEDLVSELAELVDDDEPATPDAE